MISKVCIEKGIINYKNDSIMRPIDKPDNCLIGVSYQYCTDIEQDEIHNRNCVIGQA